MDEFWQIDIAPLARRDLASIHEYSKKIWGVEAANRYSDLFDLALHNLIDNPSRLGTVEANHIKPGFRSYPLRNLNQKSFSIKVKRPKHVIYYHVREPNIVEILRILHEHMDVTTQLTPLDT